MGFPVGERVILHLDVDCFYAQVEESRRPELKGRPLGIYQKFLVVTCNYPARNAGVAKMCSKEDALRVCPELVLVNGEDLTPYRAVSKRILEVMRRFGAVERRGMDEAYLDITAEVHKRMSLAAGPNPVYKGFVGKVLAGSSKNDRCLASLDVWQTTGGSSSVKQLGPELDMTPPGDAQLAADEGVSDANKSASLERGPHAPGCSRQGASGGISEGHISGGERHVAEEKLESEGPSVKRRRLSMLEEGNEDGNEDLLRRKEAQVSFAGEGSSSALSGTGCERFVPPGWRPMMRLEEESDVSKAEEPTDDDIRLGGQGLGATFNLRADGERVSAADDEMQNGKTFGREAAEQIGRPPTPEPEGARAHPKHSSLAQAFGGVLNRPKQLLPPKQKTKPEPGISWLDWRNEVDPGLPLGEASPDHISPGKSPPGKLPGHWSDVRQVRFQPAAPEGLLKTTERLDLSADVAASDWLLLVGSHVAAEVREAIWAEVGCRCSAGIAHNKMLAKLASPMNKPNGQTTLLSKAVADHIRDLAARKIPGVGWSYDAKLRDMKIDTIGDLQKLPLSLLEEKFGARVGSMIFNCCRGNDTSLVEDKGPPKSLSVEDSFRACLNLKQAEGIVKALAPDYIDRLDEEREDTGRRPKTLTVRWRQKKASYQGQSTSGPMPLDVVTSSLPKLQREEALVRSAMGLLSKLFSGKSFHFVKLNVGATNFVEETPKGTSSLLQSWAGKAETKEVPLSQKAETRGEGVPAELVDSSAGNGTASMILSEQRQIGQESDAHEAGFGVSGRKGSGALAGSVLHANTGSKRDARAVREALEGVEPVLGNGHLKVSKRPQASDSDQEWDLDCGGFTTPNGFAGVREESEGEEDLWEDLKAVQRERHLGRAPTPDRTVDERMLGRPKQFEEGDDRKKGSGLQAFWRQSLSPSKLAEGKTVSREVVGNLQDPQGKQGEVAEVQEATPINFILKLEAAKGDLIVAPAQSDRLSERGTDSCTLSDGADEKDRCGALRRCSLCGDVIPDDLLACQDHRDRHVAMKLQAEEDRIGRLFKAASSRVGSSRSVPSQGKRPIAGGGPRKGKHTLDALWKRL